MDIITTILIVVTCSILGLGVAVVSNSRNKLNELYFVNIVTIVGWLLTILFYRLSSDATILLWTKLLYVSATFIASNFLYFTYIFPIGSAKVSIIKKILIFLPNIFIVALTLFGDQIIKNAHVSLVGENLIEFGSLYFIYVIYILFYFDLAFIRLYKKGKAATDPTEKRQIMYLFIGYMSSGIVSFATNLLLPWFGYFTLNWLGQVSTLLMAISATYAIVRHHLFSAKVIATELITFALWIILLARLLISETLADRITSGATFVTVFFAGLFLIRSVIKEVAQREKIEKLATDLEKANENQIALIHFITHQVKGFFTKSRDIFSLLLEGDAGDISDDVKKYVRLGFESDTKGVAMVQDMLTAANVKSGVVTYSVEPFDLQTLISALAIEYKSMAEGKGLTLTFVAQEGGYRVSGDQEQLRQVFKNVIENSIKYTPTGTVAIELTRSGAKTADKLDDKVVFSVKDTGVGISPEDKKLLFTQGGRGKDSTKVNVDSTGYGLFIAKGIVEAHHGRIYAESEGQGKGSQFYVELPAAN